MELYIGVVLGGIIAFVVFLKLGKKVIKPKQSVRVEAKKNPVGLRITGWVAIVIGLLFIGAPLPILLGDWEMYYSVWTVIFLPIGLIIIGVGIFALVMGRKNLRKNSG